MTTFTHIIVMLFDRGQEGGRGDERSGIRAENGAERAENCEQKRSGERACEKTIWTGAKRETAVVELKFRSKVMLLELRNALQTYKVYFSRCQK